MVEYNKVKAKLSDFQLKMLKSAVEDQTEVNLRMNIKKFKGSNLPYKLF